MGIFLNDSADVVGSNAGKISRDSVLFNRDKLRDISDREKVPPISVIGLFVARETVRISRQKYRPPIHTRRVVQSNTGRSAT